MGGQAPRSGSATLLAAPLRRPEGHLPGEVDPRDGLLGQPPAAGDRLGPGGRPRGRGVRLDRRAERGQQGGLQGGLRRLRSEGRRRGPRDVGVRLRAERDRGEAVGRHDEGLLQARQLGRRLRSRLRLQVGLQRPYVA